MVTISLEVYHFGYSRQVHIVMAGVIAQGKPEREERLLVQEEQVKMLHPFPIDRLHSDHPIAIIVPK